MIVIPKTHITLTNSKNNRIETINEYPNIDIGMIKSCGFNNVKENVIQYYCVQKVSMLKENWIVWYSSSRNIEFENQFPCFPYESSIENNFKCIVSLNSRVSGLENQLKSLEDKLDKLLSHAEALLIGEGKREFTADSIVL